MEVFLNPPIVRPIGGVASFLFCLLRRIEYAFSELAYSAGPGGAAICCLLFLIRIGLEYGAGRQALIKAGGRGFPPDSFSESNLMKKQRRS